MRKFLFLLSVVALSFTGCYEDLGPEDPNVIPIVLGTDVVETDASGGQFAVNLTSGYAWTATSNVDWIIVDSATGQPNDNILYFSVAENTSTEARQGTILVTTDDYNLSAELTVLQAAGEAPSDWVLLTDGAGNAAKGEFRGVAAIDGFWGGIANLQEMIDVNVYKHKSLEQYMVEDPWVKVYTLAFNVSEADLLSQFSWTNADLIIDCTDPNNVVIPQQSIGITENINGYGEGYIYAEGGTFANGVISFPAGKIAYTHSNLIDSYGWFATNPDGSFCLALPGYKIPRPCNIHLETAKVSEVYPEMTSQYSDETAFVYGVFVDDVVSAKCLVVETITYDRYIYNGMTAEQIVLQYGSDISSAITSSNGRGYVEMATNLTPGTSYTVAVYAENIYNHSAVLSATHTTEGTSPTQYPPCDINVITEKFSVAYPGYEAQYPDYSALAYCIGGTDIKKVLYLTAETSTVDYYLNQGVTLEELVVAKGRSDADLTSVNSENGWFSNLIGLNPNTSYTIAVYAENLYGEKKTVSATHTTDAIPYNGELVIGDYRMYNKVVSGVDEFEFENIFTVEPNGTTGTDFFVKNLGIEMNSKWYATYDAKAGTFALSGVVYGFEQYGNQFGGLYAYANAEQTAAMGFYSYATPESDAGNDPLVFTVDATTKQLCALQNDMFLIPVLDMNTGQALATWGYYAGATTTVASYTSRVTASVKSVNSVKGGNVASLRLPFSSITINKTLLNSRSNNFNFSSFKSANIKNTTSGWAARKSCVIVPLSPKYGMPAKWQGTKKIVAQFPVEAKLVK